MKKALIIPDCHIPFEDKRAYELMLTIAADWNPDEIVILGDYADFYDVSSHPKEMNVKTSLREEVEAVQNRLMELRMLFRDAKIVYIEGNHEWRLGRYLRDRAKELYEFIDLPTILDLDNLDIKFIPYGPNQKYQVAGSKLYARHEPSGGGVHCAHQTVVKSLHSVIFGHTHRIQESQIVSINGENFRGISAGWLGDKDSPVMQYVKNHHQWALGFSMAVILEDGTWFNNIIHIIDYKAVVNGKLYEG